MNYKLARIVVENISAKTDSDFITERKLISNEDLDNIPVFWTIESRLVDYLGVMSRDLGTELSLNEFLRALAPSFIDKRVSTIIPDAKLFQNELISSHTVVSAEFSRRNIQTKLEWQKNTVITGTTIPKIKIDILQKVASDLNKTGMLSRGSAEPTELLDTIDWFSRHIYIAPIQGDIKDVFIVSTLFCKVINPNCNLANVINNINQARLLSGISDDDLCKLLEGIIIITWKFRALRRYFEEIPVHALWKYYSPGLNQTLKKLNKITFDICSDQFVDIVGSYQNTFDASTYWRDWDQEDRR
jgi:molecular chaperone HtpG